MKLKKEEWSLKGIATVFLIAVIYISFGLIVLSSCKVQFVPSSNDAIKTEVSDTRQLTVDLYKGISLSPTENFAFFEEKYKQIDSNIVDLVSKDLNRPHGGIMHSELLILQTNFSRLEVLHKLHGTLNDGERETFAALIDSYWAIISDEENHYTL